MWEDEDRAARNESLWRTPAVFTAYLLVALYTLSPALVAVIAGALAAVGGESGRPAQTVLFGYNFGALDQTRDDLFRLLMFTVPTGAGAGAILTLALGMASAIRRRKTRR